MAIDYGRVMSLESRDNIYRYGDHEAMLYALGVGMGRDPLDEKELDFVFERGALKTLPSMASIVANVPLLKDCGYDYSRVLHGEESLALHRPLPPAAELVADARVLEAYDKGADKGALIYTETKVRDAADDEPLFTLTRSIFARGDGGFGGATGPSPKPHPVPDRPPDASHVRETRPDQALLFRLSGDRNPLHADPALAREVGFPAPILHGLCTCGFACAALIEGRLRLRSHPRRGPRRALLRPRLSGRRDHHRHVVRRQRHLLRVPGGGARRARPSATAAAPFETEARPARKWNRSASQWGSALVLGGSRGEGLVGNTRLRAGIEGV